MAVQLGRSRFTDQAITYPMEATIGSQRPTIFITAPYGQDSPTASAAAVTPISASQVSNSVAALRNRAIKATANKNRFMPHLHFRTGIFDQRVEVGRPDHSRKASLQQGGEGNVPIGWPGTGNL